MTPQQLLTAIKQQPPAAAYLFIGPEPYQREWCRRALIERALPDPEERDNGLTRYDLDETTLDAVLEDACSLSLFTTRRVIVAGSAEAALPRGKAVSGEEEDAGSGAALARYLKDPVPGVVVVFEAARYDFQGEDKKKLDRVRKFYAAVPEVVEFPRMSESQARQFAQKLAQRAGLEIGAAELEMLVEALGGEAARIAAEIEKLKLYGKPVGAREIAELVPEARQATIFALVGALGRNDRVAALDVLDTLVRQREYLPLALSFLATQFRLALAAREAGLRSAQQISSHFSRMGVPMWYSRAEQVFQTVSTFSRAQLTAALEAIYDADRGVRDANPDDRIVIENFILSLKRGQPDS